MTMLKRRVLGSLASLTLIASSTSFLVLHSKSEAIHLNDLTDVTFDDFVIALAVSNIPPAFRTPTTIIDEANSLLPSRTTPYTIGVNPGEVNGSIILDPDNFDYYDDGEPDQPTFDDAVIILAASNLPAAFRTAANIADEANSLTGSTNFDPAKINRIPPALPGPPPTPSPGPLPVEFSENTGFEGGRYVLVNDPRLRLTGTVTAPKGIDRIQVTVQTLGSGFIVQPSDFCSNTPPPSGKYTTCDINYTASLQGLTPSFDISRDFSVQVTSGSEFGVFSAPFFVVNVIPSPPPEDQEISITFSGGVNNVFRLGEEVTININANIPNGLGNNPAAALQVQSQLGGSFVFFRASQIENCNPGDTTCVGTAKYTLPTNNVQLNTIINLTGGQDLILRGFVYDINGAEKASAAQRIRVIPAAP